MQIGAGCATPAARAKLSQKTSWNGIGTCAEAQNFKMLLPNRCFDDIRNIEISKYRNIEISK